MGELSRKSKGSGRGETGVGNVQKNEEKRGKQIRLLENIKMYGDDKREGKY